MNHISDYLPEVFHISSEKMLLFTETTYRKVQMYYENFYDIYNNKDITPTTDFERIIITKLLQSIHKTEQTILPLLTNKPLEISSVRDITEFMDMFKLTNIQNSIMLYETDEEYEYEDHYDEEVYVK